MKKTIAVLVVLLLVCVAAFATAQKEVKETPDVKGEGVMTYAEYVAAPLEKEVVIEAYVQAHQSWWNDSITLYLQDKDGGYFVYNCACPKETAEKLVEGTKVKVTGYKSEWAGEVEIVDGIVEILDGSYIAPATDVTAYLETDELITYINRKVSFKGMKVAPSLDGEAFLYSWDGSGSKDSDADLYFNVSLNGQTYTFCVEYYLCDRNTEVSKAVENLKVGDTVDLEGFLYWYNGANPHITNVTVK